LQTDEINIRAAILKKNSFSVSRQQVDYYRKSRKVDILAIKQVDENNALTTGLSIAEERVRRLQVLAELMWKDLTGGFLWIDDVKGVGSGNNSEIVDFEKFNNGELAEFRATLEDIAKETGGRANKTDITSDGEKLSVNLIINKKDE
jgi:hypothetical protein